MSFHGCCCLPMACLLNWLPLQWQQRGNKKATKKQNKKKRQRELSKVDWQKLLLLLNRHRCFIGGMKERKKQGKAKKKSCFFLTEAGEF